MMNHKNLLIGISVFVVICLVFSTVALGKDCKRINARAGKVGEERYAPDCGGYDVCQSVQLKGTPNGVYTYYANWDTFFPYVDDTTLVFADDVIIETNHGEIFVEERGVIHLNAPGGLVIHANITGGTGRYQGATGWWGNVGSSQRSTLEGEICYPGAGEE
jgi:hypothetical protein